MIEIPAGAGNITTIDPDELDTWQAGGWKPIGILTETVVEEHENVIPCKGSFSPDMQCRHGIMGGGCTSFDTDTISVPVEKARLVLVADVQTTLGKAQETILALRKSGSELLHAKESADVLLGKVQEMSHKATQEMERMKERIETLQRSKYKLNATIQSLNTKHYQQTQENRQMRTAIHTRAMADVLGATELARAGEFMHPMAFVMLLDSMERYTTDPEQYVHLIKDMLERSILQVEETKEGGKSIRIVDLEGFDSAMRSMDAEKRLVDGKIRNTEACDGGG